MKDLHAVFQMSAFSKVQILTRYTHAVQLKNKIHSRRTKFNEQKYYRSTAFRYDTCMRRGRLPLRSFDKRKDRFKEDLLWLVTLMRICFFLSEKSTLLELLGLTTYSALRPTNTLFEQSVQTSYRKEHMVIKPYAHIHIHPKFIY